MVVEDEPDLYDTLLALFEIWSIDGVAFTNGTDAIKWIEDVDKGDTDTNIPELAILDIRLPGATGPEIGARIRKSPVLKNIAIVLMTAYHLAPKGEQEVVAQAQADTLLYKPLPAPPEFRTLLKKAIDHRRGENEPGVAPKSSTPNGDNSTSTGVSQ
jgi:CheY-like chemotaxis protein